MDFRCKTLQLIIVIVLQRLSRDHKIRLWIQILHLRILYLLPLSVSIRLEFRCKTSRIIWDPFAAILCYHKVRQSLHNVTIERSEATGCYRDKSGPQINIEDLCRETNPAFNATKLQLQFVFCHGDGILLQNASI